jgi:hypothetical protein
MFARNRKPYSAKCGVVVKAGSLDHIWPVFSQKHKMHHNRDLQMD